MFSENNKISVRQTKYLLQLDWIARLVILLPVCLSGKTVGSAVFCVLAGTAAWWLLLNGVLNWTRTGRASGRKGRTGAWTERTRTVTSENLTNRSKAAAGENSTNRSKAAAGENSTNRSKAAAGENLTNWSRVAVSENSEACVGVLREMKEVMGSGASIFLCTAGLLFFLVQAAVFLNLTASVCSVYLLPEVPVQLICLLPVAAAILLGAGGIEVQGRFCEVAGPIVVTVLTGLIFLSAFGMNGYVYEETVVQLSDHLAAGSFEVFACLGGLSLPLVVRHLAGELPAQTVKKSGLASALIAGSLCAITIGSYGKNGMLQMEFPAIRVMSNLRLPGVFLQRWDVLFLAFLLIGLTVTAAESLWCVKEILGALWELGDEVRDTLAESNGPERAGGGFQRADGANYKNVSAREAVLKPEGSLVRRSIGDSEIGTQKINKLMDRSGESKSNRIAMSWAACIFLVYLAAAGFLSQWTAIGYYRALNLQLLTPAIFLFYIIAGWVRKRKTAVNCPRGLILVLLALVSAFFLGGCTAYEPEERLFPMAMEIRVEEGQLVMAYAWNEGAGPGSVSAGEDAEAASGESEAEDAAEVSARRSAETAAEEQTTEASVGAAVEERASEENVDTVVKEQVSEENVDTVVKGQRAEDEAAMTGQTAEDETAVKEPIAEISAEAAMKEQKAANEATEKGQMTEDEAIKKGQMTEDEAAAKEQETENEATMKEHATENETAMPLQTEAAGKYAETSNGLTIFRGKSLEEIQEKTTAFSERYMDYSHVKAILLDYSLSEMPELEKTVIDWLAQEPAFASGLIIYEIDEKELALEQVQRQAGGQVGKYLENLYKNNEAYREQSTTLGQLIAEYYA